MYKFHFFFSFETNVGDATDDDDDKLSISSPHWILCTYFARPNIIFFASFLRLSPTSQSSGFVNSLISDVIKNSNIIWYNICPIIYIYLYQAASVFIFKQFHTQNLFYEIFSIDKSWLFSLCAIFDVNCFRSFAICCKLWINNLCWV